MKGFKGSTIALLVVVVAMASVLIACGKKGDEIYEDGKASTSNVEASEELSSAESTDFGGSKDAIVENEVSEEGEDMQQQAIEYLIEKFGMTEEELQGVDAVKFIDDYKIKEFDYTAEEIREILSDQKYAYVDDGTTEIYDLIEKEGDAVQSEDQIKRIAYRRVSGTEWKTAVFDLRKGEFYVDDTQAHEMTDEQKEMISSLYSTYGVEGWKREYYDARQATTGSFEWRLVLEYKDGNISSYKGYTTSNFDSFPDNFKEMDSMLEDMMRAVN